MDIKQKITRAAIGTLTVGVLVAAAATGSAQAAPSSSLCDISAGLDATWEWASNITVASTSINPDFTVNDYVDASGDPGMPIALTAGDTYSISMTVDADTAAAQADWLENVVVWIDYNGDGTLDSSEIVLNDGSDTSTWPINSDGYAEQTFSGTFTVPTDAVAGEQWARALNYDPTSAPDPIEACWDPADTVYGSATDFTTTLSPAAPTPAPSPSETTETAALASTGASTAEPFAAGATLLLIGGLTALVAWRRRRTN